jgi:hypothetical protein
MARNLRAINYYGSKVANAHRYPAPIHDMIVEPFAGGAGYSLLHWQKRVILVDLDPAIVGVWRYLIDTTPDEIMALPLIEPGQDVRELGCSGGGRLLISWCLNQLAHPARHMSSWAVYHTKRGAACYWGNRRRKQAALIAGRVKHWQIFAGSYADAPDIEATWFVDPPYADGGRRYKHSAIDYAALASWCHARCGQTIVCEREGADWLPFRPLYNAPTQAPSQGTRRRHLEAVWP